MRNAKITGMLYQDREMLTWRKTSNVALFPKTITVTHNSVAATEFWSRDKNRYRASTNGVENPTTSQRSFLIIKETIVA